MWGWRETHALDAVRTNKQTIVHLLCVWVGVFYVCLHSRTDQRSDTETTHQTNTHKHQPLNMQPNKLLYLHVSHKRTIRSFTRTSRSRCEAHITNRNAAPNTITLTQPTTHLYGRNNWILSSTQPLENNKHLREKRVLVLWTSLILCVFCVLFVSYCCRLRCALICWPRSCPLNILLLWQTRFRHPDKFAGNAKVSPTVNINKCVWYDCYIFLLRLSHTWIILLIGLLWFDSVVYNRLISKFPRIQSISKSLWFLKVHIKVYV